MKAARPVREGADGKVLRATGVTRRRPTLLLDCNYDDGMYDGFADPWDDEVIAEGTEEWRKARAIMDAVYKLADWLEDDLPANFAEMLDFILERLGNSNPTTEENDHE